MKSILILTALLLFVLFIKTKANELPIEGDTRAESTLEKYNPFKVLGSKTNDGKTTTNPLATLFRDSILYLLKATNASVELMNRTSTDFFSRVKEDIAKKSLESNDNSQSHEVVEDEPIDKALSPSRIQSDSPIQESDPFSEFITPLLRLNDPDFRKKLRDEMPEKKTKKEKDKSPESEDPLTEFMSAFFPPHFELRNPVGALKKFRDGMSGKDEKSSELENPLTNFMSAFLPPQFQPRDPFGGLKLDQQQKLESALMPLLILDQAFKSMDNKHVFKMMSPSDGSDGEENIAWMEDDEMVVLPHKLVIYPKDPEVKEDKTGPETSSETSESSRKCKFGPCFSVYTEKMIESMRKKDSISVDNQDKIVTKAPEHQATTLSGLLHTATVVSVTPKMMINSSENVLEIKKEDPEASPKPTKSPKNEEDKNGFTAVSRFEQDFMSTNSFTPPIEATTPLKVNEEVTEMPKSMIVPEITSPDKTPNLHITNQEALKSTSSLFPHIVLNMTKIDDKEGEEDKEDEWDVEKTDLESGEENKEDKEIETPTNSTITLKDPLKVEPIELENFLSKNFTTAQRNESINSLQMLVSIPLTEDTPAFYNMAVSRLKEAAPQLKEVNLDGGYVRGVLEVNNEEDDKEDENDEDKEEQESNIKPPLQFSAEIKFLRLNLIQILNSLQANNISVGTFDYNVWVFEREDFDHLADNYASALADLFQSRVYPHVYSKDLRRFEMEASFEWSNVNLTVYVIKQTNTTFVLAPFNKRQPYYTTLLPTLEPFFVFLRSLQKSMKGIVHSMQKWIHNGRPMTEGGELKKSKPMEEINLRSRSENFGQHKGFEFAREFFDPSKLPFVGAVQKSFGLDSIMPKHK